MASFAEEIASLALANYCRNSGAMYGSAAQMAPGAGVVIRNVRYAFFNEESGNFAAYNGTALVLTHECDIEQSNVRHYNKHLIVAPLIYIENFAREFDEKKSEARSLITSIARGEISRLYFLPPPSFNAPELDKGAIVYLNALASTHISQISSDPDDKIFALSEYGLAFADFMLQQHLLRPKDDQMANLGPAYRPLSIYAAPKR